MKVWVRKWSTKAKFYSHCNYFNISRQTSHSSEADRRSMSCPHIPGMCRLSISTRTLSSVTRDHTLEPVNNPRNFGASKSYAGYKFSHGTPKHNGPSLSPNAEKGVLMHKYLTIYSRTSGQSHQYKNNLRVPRWFSAERRSGRKYSPQGLKEIFEEIQFGMVN